MVTNFSWGKYYLIKSMHIWYIFLDLVHFFVHLVLVSLNIQCNYAMYTYIWLSFVVNQLVNYSIH